MPRLEKNQLTYLEAVAVSADGVERAARIGIKKGRMSAQNYVSLLELGRSIVENLEKIDDHLDDDDDDDDG